MYSILTPTSKMKNSSGVLGVCIACFLVPNLAIEPRLANLDQAAFKLRATLMPLPLKCRP